MKCQNCKGEARMVKVGAKCSDRYWEVNIKTGKEYVGYGPDWISQDGNGGDYVEFTVCRHCGQMQGKWPINGEGQDKFKWGKTS